MQTTAPAPQDQPLNLLADWISREVLYRRTSVQDWISAQEQTRPARTRPGRK